MVVASLSHCRLNRSVGSTRSSVRVMEVTLVNPDGKRMVVFDGTGDCKPKRGSGQLDASMRVPSGVMVSRYRRPSWKLCVWVPSGCVVVRVTRSMSSREMWCAVVRPSAELMATVKSFSVPVRSRFQNPPAAFSSRSRRPESSYWNVEANPRGFSNRVSKPSVEYAMFQDSPSGLVTRTRRPSPLVSNPVRCPSGATIAIGDPLGSRSMITVLFSASRMETSSPAGS